MSVFANSRHQNQQKYTATFTNSLGEKRTVSWLTLHETIPFQSFKDNKTITLGRNVTLQAIATVFYNDPTLWWVIAEFNQIIDPTPVEEGGELQENMKLVVPSLKNVLTKILPNA